MIVQDKKLLFHWQDEKNLFEAGWSIDDTMVAVAMESHGIAVIDVGRISAPEGTRALRGGPIIPT